VLFLRSVGGCVASGDGKTHVATAAAGVGAEEGLTGNVFVLFCGNPT
jgi:hypothetical protein